VLIPEKAEKESWATVPENVVFFIEVISEVSMLFLQRTLSQSHSLQKVINVVFLK
jgi:hypothetical protein